VAPHPTLPHIASNRVHTNLTSLLMSASDDLTLGQLLSRAISTAFKVSAAPSANQPTIQVSPELILQTVLDLLG